MKNERSYRRCGLRLLAIFTFFLLNSVGQVSAQITMSFEGVNYTTIRLEEGSRPIYKDPIGTITLKWKNDVVLAKGQLQVFQDILMALKGNKGSSFKYIPKSKKVDLIVYPKKKPSEFATLSLDKQNLWVLTNDSFLFLWEDMGGEPNLLLPESIARASIITIPLGTFELFGYNIKALKDGAKVKFLHGSIVESSDCNIK